jgi:glycine/D-amino acid oxidase-like deaminating enzyme
MQALRRLVTTTAHTNPLRNATTRAMATVAPQHFMATSGETEPVWVATEPYSNRPKFTSLKQNTSADVCVIGSGIAGVQSAYELVKRGHHVVMLEARDAVSGETDRTSGHLASALDDRYLEIAKKHGDDGARQAADSHKWASKHVGDVAKELGIDCEYRQLPAYLVSQYSRQSHSREHDDDVKNMIKPEAEQAARFGVDSVFKEGYAIQGWDGKPDQRDATMFGEQATFHPTKYVVGVLRWLKEQPSFTCYTRSRVMDVQEKGMEIMGIGKKTVVVSTDDGHNVECSDAIMATCVPLQKLSMIAEMEYMRTYCVAIRIPKGTVEDCLLYDTAEDYKYLRITHCDEHDDYLIVGGEDHKVGQEVSR